MKAINNPQNFYWHGWADDLNILEELSTCGIFNSGNFPYNEERESSLPRVFFRVYHNKEETTLDEAMEGFVKRMCGAADVEGSSYGYSEVTIEGFSLHDLKIGGHDIPKLLKGFPGEYLHVLIDVLPKEEPKK